MKPNVGLTLFTSSFMIFLTIVVFPALSSPLHIVSRGPEETLNHSQHQNSHFLVFQTSLAEYRQHVRRLVSEVGVDKRKKERNIERVEKETLHGQRSRGRVRYKVCPSLTTDSIRCMYCS